MIEQLGLTRKFRLLSLFSDITLSKAFWSNIDEVHATVNTLKQMKSKASLLSMDMPLHKGALRYDKEVGISIPARLVPLEAR